MYPPFIGSSKPPTLVKSSPEKSSPRFHMIIESTLSHDNGIFHIPCNNKVMEYCVKKWYTNTGEKPRKEKSVINIFNLCHIPPDSLIVSFPPIGLRQY